jgi:hypothetical protein
MKRNFRSQSAGTIGLSQLRQLISEETRKILNEAKDEEEKGEDSLDSQVDSFFSDFESKAKKVVKKESRDFQSFMKKLLREAEEDEEEKDKAKEDEDKEPEKLKSEDIDVETFVNEVIRLIENYDSLLEIRNTILRRAVNYLLKSYESDVADTFKEVLEDNHGLEIGKSKIEMEDEEFVAPRADRAGASPGGA